MDGLRSAMDLEHSFGPAYVRGRLLSGTAADAVIGVSETESSATIDGILTLGILWLDHCRRHGDGRRHFGGLKVSSPQDAWRPPPSAWRGSITRLPISSSSRSTSAAKSSRQ